MGKQQTAEALPATASLPETALPSLERNLGGIYPVAKRVVDLIIATGTLVVLAPVWLAIALAIKIESPGPALFRQVRLGQNGKPFLLYKFRSMRVDGDDSEHRSFVAALIDGQAASHGAVNGTAYFKLRRDPRITRVGRIIRKTSLDEIPQLFNVVRGDMSIVGPRPPLQYEVDRYQFWHWKRLATKPGITGYWQVYGRSRVSFDEMVRMDLTYIADASLGLDAKLMVLTLPALFRGAD